MTLLKRLKSIVRILGKLDKQVVITVITCEGSVR